MLNRLLAIFLICSFVFPLPLSAQTIYKIKAGQKAPVEGYLYDNLAQARALVEKKTDLEREKLKHQRELDKQRVNLTLTASIARIDAEAEKQRRVRTNAEKDKRIEKLEKDLLDERDRTSPVVYVTLGALGGALLVFGTALVWAKIAESQKP